MIVLSAIIMAVNVILTVITAVIWVGGTFSMLVKGDQVKDSDSPITSFREWVILTLLLAYLSLLCIILVRVYLNIS